jgi:hypothetical protein
MLPSGAYLKRLNDTVQSDTQYYAVASQFVPSYPGLFKRFGSLVGGKFIAGIFNEDNDGVVPTLGCYEGVTRALAFPIPPERRLVFGPADQIHHCNFFGNQQLTEKLLEWLAN